MDFASRDIISSLPNALISHILSFIPTKEAASTSLLSKKWRYLFAFATNLEFDDSVYLHPEVGKQEGDDKPGESFMGFVDKVLVLQGNGIVNRFSLDCSDYVDQARVTSWIFNVLGRGVSDLYLSLMEYSLPSKIFMSKTLFRLKLGPAVDLSYTVEDVSLPKLKTLYIDSVVFVEEGVGFAKLLSGCPVIEELVVMNIGWEHWNFCSVSSTTLKRLKFFCEDTDEHPKSVLFNTPKLVYLEYSDAVAGKYPKVKFDSLVEAHMGLRLTEDQLEDADVDARFSEEEDYLSEGDEENEMACNATDFLMGICNVQILYLSAKTIEVLSFCCKPMPVFKNLIQLTIESNAEIGWDSFPSLLKNCPILETLVLKRLDHKYNYGCGNVCRCNRPVKVLKIFLFEDSDEEDGSEIRQIKHFLEKMPCLEQLIVYYNTSYDPAVFKLSIKLQKIPRIASPKCKIQVISENLSLSSTLPCSLTTNWSALLPEEEEEDSLFESAPSPDTEEDTWFY